MPTFRPFAGLRYRATDLSRLVAPPYDVISERQHAELEDADPFNAVRLELPREEGGRDRWALAATRLTEWQRGGGPLARDAEPAFYLYRMSFTDETGAERHTLGVIGALGLEGPGRGEILPHEHTTPRAKLDRLGLLRATRTNLSPVWGLSLTPGLAARCSEAARTVGDPVAHAERDGVRDELWCVQDRATLDTIAGAVASAPVVIADGHHRYEVAYAYEHECHDAGLGDGGWDAVMTFVVELSEDQLAVAAIHRLLSGLPDDFDLAGALAEWFEPAGTVALGPTITADMVRAGALALAREPGKALLLRPRAETIAAADKDLDSSLLEVALATLPHHVLVYQHGVENVTAALASGAAQAAILLRPPTIAQIAAVARARDRMPPKTTFFTPKLATGLVFRSLE